MWLGIWIVLYLTFTMLVGFIASRRIHSTADFLSASRRLPLLLNASALFAFWYGSETVLGASAEFIDHGVLGVIEDPFGGFLCLILFAVLLARPLYRQNIFTLGDLFRRVYGRQIERLSSVFMILSFFGYVAAQIIALGILCHTVFGIDETYGRLISAVLVTAYTAAGGMWSVSITDFIQSVVIIFGLLFIAVYLTGLVDISQIFVAPQPGFFDAWPQGHSDLGWLDYLAAWCSLGLGSLASQDVFQRVNAAKTERIAVRSTYLGAFLYLIFAMIPLYLALLSFQLVPHLTTGDNQHTVMKMIAGYAPFWLQVLFYGALISAVFSTCSGAMLAPASLLSENLLKSYFKTEVTDKQLLMMSRISVIIISVFSTVLSLVSDSIYELVSQSSILGMVSILVPLLGALFYPTRQTDLGAWLSMTCGLIAYTLFETIQVLQIIPSMFPGFAVSLAGLLLGNHLALKKSITN